MALVPHKITALAESDADGTDGKNIVAGAAVSLYDSSGAAVTLFDDEAGNNGSTAKQTDASGQVVVWVTAGEYEESVNGSTQRAVTIGGRTITSYANTASLENSRPTQTGQRAENRERGNAQYELADSGYTSLPGDIVAANGRVWSLITNEAIKIEWMGAVGDGVTDDTQAFNDAISRIGVGGGIELKPDAVYAVTNVILKNKTGTNVYNYISCSGGMATILALDGGEPEALVLDERFISDSTFPVNGYRWENVIFDNKAGLKDYAYINRTYHTELKSCNVYGGYLFTRESRGGVITSTYLANSKHLFSKFFHKEGGDTSTPTFSTRPIGDGPTDGYIIGCDFDGGRVSSNCVDMGSAGGWIITNNHTFEGVESDVNIRDMSGNPPTFSNNEIEELVIIGNIGNSRPFKTGGGNVYFSDVRVDFGDGSVEHVHISGDTFGRGSGFGSPSKVVHNSSDANKFITISNCEFNSGVFYDDVNNTGNVSCINCSSSNTKYNGKLSEKRSSDSFSFNETRTEGGSSAFTTFHEERYIAKNDASESVTYISAKYQTGSTADGSETGQYRITAINGSSEKTLFTCFGGGIGVGSNNSQGDGTVNATRYYSTGSAGSNGSFTSNDGKTITVSGGIITSIV